MKKVESYEKLFSEEEKKQIINDYVENYLSLRELRKKYSIGSKYWLDKLLKGKTRSLSEAGKIAHKKYSESFKHTDETKQKIREKHLKWMKEHPEQTAWRLKNMSYPEKCFQKILEDNGLDKKHLIYREYSVFPYFIDFAFINEKLAVEIDGSQHLEEERKKRDEKKDELLISKGWRVLRIAAFEVTHDGTKALNGVLKMLSKTSVITSVVGILKAPKTHKKNIRGKDGLTDKQRQKALNQRKIKEMPTKEELWEMIKTQSFVAIGNKYNISDNAVRKWCKRYNLPYRKKDINSITGKGGKYASIKKICKRCGKEFIARRDGNIFCSNECYKKYIKEHGNKEFHNTIKYNWIYKESPDGSFINKRVSKNEIEQYTNDGWTIGRLLNNK